MERKIQEFIENYQRGKTGIYPHQVALLVCAEFLIPLPDATEHVLAHIKAEMARS